MNNNRKRIPTKITDEVSFLSDLVCPVYQSPGHHIHHLDGNPSNNDIDNLILLCFKHHDEATVKGKLSRKPSKGVLIRYRDLHYKNVQLKRQMHHGTKARKNHEPLMERGSLGCNGCTSFNRR